MTETPILNALNNPYQINTPAGGAGSVQEYVDMLLTNRATVFRVDRLMPHLRQKKMIDEAPGCILHWPLLFIETDTHPGKGGGGAHVGILAYPLSASSLIGWYESLPGSGEPMTPEVKTRLLALEAKAPTTTRERLVTMMSIWFHANGVCCGPVINAAFCADPDNDYQINRYEVGFDEIFSLSVRVHEPFRTRLRGEVFLALAARCTAIVAMACAFAGASNVQMVDDGYSNDHVGGKQRDAKRLPWIRRSVLKIREGDQLLELDHGLSGTGPRARSLVRGHFRRCGVDGRKPMFGKLIGYYYIRPHLRGTVDAGAIAHDYEAIPNAISGEGTRERAQPRP